MKETVPRTKLSGYGRAYRVLSLLSLIPVLVLGWVVGAYVEKQYPQGGRFSFAAPAVVVVLAWLGFLEWLDDRLALRDRAFLEQELARVREQIRAAVDAPIGDGENPSLARAMESFQWLEAIAPDHPLVGEIRTEFLPILQAMPEKELEERASPSRASHRFRRFLQELRGCGTPWDLVAQGLLLSGLALLIWNAATSQYIDFSGAGGWVAVVAGFTTLFRRRSVILAFGGGFLLSCLLLVAIFSLRCGPPR